MAPFLDEKVSDIPTPVRSPVLEQKKNPSNPNCFNNVDIAVVGMACRLPGDNNTPEQFWQSILNQQVAVGDLPSDRWEAYHRRDPRNPKILNETTQRGYFVKNINDFDNTFFGISPKEAALMDPQQRMALEVTWEALEHAGIAPQSLAGSDTACYVGVNSDDFGKMVLEDLPGIEAWLGIGTAYCGVPNRISYHLDLKGPSTAVDAACASSLVAVHHGRMSLIAGETNLAIVGGVQALCNPGMSRVLDLAGATAKDGECRSFDDSAHGYGRGEGAVVIILKRLVDAERDDDRILAVLKGSAVGQDGKTNGIMAPNGEAQAAVAAAALADISPSSIQYVEAHATSTAVGDPVEITAMSKVYGSTRDAQDPCFIGSSKANVGHLEAGAGAVGFAKAVMAIQHGTIPPQANLKVPNTKIDWQKSGIEVATQARPWPLVNGPRRAAVSSYGYGGSVSHAVVESASQVKESDTEIATFPTVLLLTAPQEKRLAGCGKLVQDHLAASGGDNAIFECAATLATRRGHHVHRLGAVVNSRKEALHLLEKISHEESNASIISGRSSNEGPGTVWVFSGHGAQWPDMAKELLQDEPVFRLRIEALDQIIWPETGFSALELLQSGSFQTTDQIQVLTYAVQIGLAALLQSQGCEPQAVIGHSVGEIAAAVVAGALTEEEGAIIVSRRAVLYRQVMGKGAMALISIPFKAAETMLEGQHDVWAAIDASSTSCVVSGTIAAVEEFTKRCQAEAIQIRKVASDVAFHTPQLKDLARPLLQGLQDLKPRAPMIPLYSTATPNARKYVVRDGSYWVKNMINPVLLTNAVKAAVEDGFRMAMEVSSHPIVAHSISETVMDQDIEDFVIVPTLLRNKPARATILRSMITLWSRGASIDWRKTFDGIGWDASVPLTQWQHKEFRKAIGTGSPTMLLEHDVDTHTLLGQEIAVAGEDQTLFTSQLSNDNKPFPGSHPLHGTEIIPAAVLLNTFLKAGQTTRLRDIHLKVPVAISAPRQLQVLVQSDSVRLSSRLVQSDNDAARGDQISWLTHTTAKVDTAPIDSGLGDKLDIEALRSAIGPELKNTFSVDYLADVGVPLMGFPWRVLYHAGNTERMLAYVDACPDAIEGKLPWKTESWAPLFDAATSIGSTLFFNEPRLRMPAHVKDVEIRPDVVPPKLCYILVEASQGGKVEIASDVTIAGVDGKVLAKFTCMRFSEIEGTPGASESIDGLVHQLAWTPAKLLDEPLPLSHVVLVADKEHPLVGPYQRQLGARGIQHTTISIADLTGINASLQDAAIVYLPSSAISSVQVSDMAEQACDQLLQLTKHVVNTNVSARIYVVTQNVLGGGEETDLAQSCLPGLSRIIASEQPQIWGALVDVDSDAVPFQCLKYVAGEDMICMRDSVARAARLKPVPRAKQPLNHRFDPKSDKTYLITGGLGALGLEVASHLVENGARRIVLLSRRCLPPRSRWSETEGETRKAIEHIQALEEQGATVIPVAVDLGAENAAVKLKASLDALHLPPVAGVVHAAGVVENQLVMSTTPESFKRVLAPKVTGTLALHAAFPPKSLDFFILFSSCGQLLGFPGQASYASANSFLDSLAEHRRRLGDTATVSFQWTSWRGVGGMGDNDFVNEELENRGITSISSAEAFKAADVIASHDSYNASSAVVLRSRVFDNDEPLPHRVLEHIAIRRHAEPANAASQAVEGASKTKGTDSELPPPGPERLSYLQTTISKCVATVLQFSSPDEVDAKGALSDMGMDSVMTATFRKLLQSTLKVKVPPTLVWGHPTVTHLVGWFNEQLSKDKATGKAMRVRGPF